MREVAPCGELAVKSRELTFKIDSLVRLRSPKRLNDELILLCLHLSQKHRYVRVGFSVPLHQQANGANLMAKPFEKAAGQIDQWRATEPNMVCFSPLNQRNNHFSLLEVDCKRDTIHYYDSFEEGPDASLGMTFEAKWTSFFGGDFLTFCRRLARLNSPRLSLSWRSVSKFCPDD